MPVAATSAELTPFRTAPCPTAKVAPTPAVSGFEEIHGLAGGLLVRGSLCRVCGPSLPPGRRRGTLTVQRT